MMLPSYRLLPRILRWFRRFRQRRGYGVHSPFAFEWITDVVYLQKAQYYAYAPLAEQHEAWQGVLSVKDARLLFRIANHQRAQRMLVVGQGIEREIHYLQAARPSAQIVHLPDVSSVEKALSSETSPEQPFDFVLWMAAESPSLPVLSHLCTRMTEHPEKTLEFFQKTLEIFPKTLEIFPKMSHVFSETSDNSILPSDCSASSLPSLEVEAPLVRTFAPISAVDITPEGISIDGIALPFEERGAALLPAAYKNLIWGYPKFHKMDVLSQLAFVATELLVQSIPHLDTHTAVVFLTHHGSLAADVHYQSTIVPTAEEFFPSPAAFVYTLPNIATGEVAIRHHWHGHTACYALPTTAEEALQQSLILSPASDGRTTAIVGGWLDAEDAEHFSAHLQLYLPTTNI